MKLADGIVRFAEALAIRGRSARTIIEYRWMLERFGGWAATAGVALVADCTRELLRGFQGELLRHTTDKARQLSPASIALRLTVIRQFFAYLTREGFLLADPARDLELPRKRPRTAAAPVLTVREVEILLATPDVRTLHGLRDRAVLEVLYGSGLRRAELVALCVEDVDLSAATVTVKRGKGGAGRVVPTTRESVRWLRLYLTRVRARWAWQLESRILFLSSHRKPISAPWVYHAIKEYGRRAGLKKSVTVHALRHACATHLLEGGADVRVVQKILGHRQLGTTATYTHVGMPHLRRVVQRCHPRGRRART